MTEPNQENYEAAQDRIKSGRWSVDPEAGLVYGARGLPFSRRNNNGYIFISFRDAADYRTFRSALGHRVIWEYVNGPIAPGLDINHLNGVKTDNRIVNLEAVTRAENNRHARETGLHVSVCGELAGRSKLTEDQVRDIYRRAWAGENQRTIGAEYSISSTSVSAIKCRLTWAHIDHDQVMAS